MTKDKTARIKNEIEILKFQIEIKQKRLDELNQMIWGEESRFKLGDEIKWSSVTKGKGRVVGFFGIKGRLAGWSVLRDTKRKDEKPVAVFEWERPELCTPKTSVTG